MDSTRKPAGQKHQYYLSLLIVFVNNYCITPPVGTHQWRLVEKQIMNDDVKHGCNKSSEETLYCLLYTQREVLRSRVKLVISISQTRISQCIHERGHVKAELLAAYDQSQTCLDRRENNLILDK